MKKSFWFFAAIVAFLLVQAPLYEGSSHALAAVTTGIDYRDGRIRISVDGRPLEDVVEEVARKTGIRVIDNHPSQEAVSIHLDYLPVAASLQRLLQGRDYVFFYRAGKPGDEPLLTQVVVLPKTGGRVTAGPDRDEPTRLSTEDSAELQASSFRNAGLEQILEDVGTQQINIESTITNALQQIHEMAPLPLPETRRDDAQHAPGPGAMIGSANTGVRQDTGTLADRTSSQSGESAPVSLTKGIENTERDDPEQTKPDDPGPGEPGYDPLAPLRPILEQALEAQKNTPPQSDNPFQNQ
jgi:hypothetical protein